MKKKREGLVAAALLLASATTLAGYTVWAYWSFDLRSAAKGVRMTPPTMATNVPSLGQLDYVEKRLPALAAPVNPDAGPVNLGLLGRADTQTLSTERVEGPRSAGDYQVTMTFTGGGKSFCLINGNLYRPGAELPDGARVVGIDSKRVYLDRRGVTTVVPVMAWHLGAPVKKSKGGDNTTAPQSPAPKTGPSGTGPAPGKAK